MLLQKKTRIVKRSSRNYLLHIRAGHSMSWTKYDSDCLNSDITDICTYMKEVIMSMRILHPKTFAVVLKLMLKFCVQNFQPI